jgi:Polyketide cyclase / dehydrase and lipid transport
MVFDSVHVSTSIDRAADEVYAFASDPANLASWAAGLANQVVDVVDGRLVVDSPMGRVTVQFAPPNQFGILDHDVNLPSGETVSNPMRVIPNGDGCDVVFTVRRRAGVSAEAFAADQDAVAADLATLRDLMQRA